MKCAVSIISGKHKYIFFWVRFLFVCVNNVKRYDKIDLIFVWTLHTVPAVRVNACRRAVVPLRKRGLFAFSKNIFSCMI